MSYDNLIIFDLDGVLIDSREMHYNTLNIALLEVVGEKYMITREEQQSRYDGLPTKKKLQMLTEEKGLDASRYDAIYNKKQDATVLELLDLSESEKLLDIFWRIKSYGFRIAVASNAIRSTVITALRSLGVFEYVDHIVSNQDVNKAKPYPEMYWECMKACNAVPSTTIIIEDSHIGRQGAIESGATLLAVENPDDVTWDKIFPAIRDHLHKPKSLVPWKRDKLNVLIPMAGAGSRFAAAGYTFPKPLIEVHNKPMIQVVVENLNIEARYIFLVQKEHYEKYNLKYLLSLISPGCEIVVIDGMTQGAACTTLLAKDLIDTDAPLIIANSDQFVEWNSNEAMYAFTADGVDGGILAFHATHPKWSYVALDKDGFASEVAEKKVISDNATVGIYFWKKGSDYVKYATQMIEANDRTNGEFYVAPTFNYAIKDGKKIRVHYAEEMWGIGTPEDLNYFLTHHK